MPTHSPAPERTALRQHLLAERERFVLSPAAADAARALEDRLVAVLAQLVPECLGVYWPMRSEFNAAHRWRVDDVDVPLALPFARRDPPSMQYRVWDGREPAERDDCNIPTASGGPVTPDVVLVPCVGFTDDGYRLGYGGGFFDRYMEKHPDTTAIGVAWSVGRIEPGAFVPQAHDRPLMLVVTESGVVG
ncbi:5-formyltetrahydrofolate cyclo-ligase [Piscinibacter gummiphilus]|nr:5-formyltetrahydrofolate cyclo-ligase [Piscinibacter gummiphilus]